MELGIFSNLKICKYAEYEISHEYFSTNFLKIFRTAFSENTVGGMLLILFDCLLKTSFNPLRLGGNKRSCILKETFN